METRVALETGNLCQNVHVRSKLLLSLEFISLVSNMGLKTLVLHRTGVLGASAEILEIKALC